MKRLLKSNPEERIGIAEMLSHPWMRAHAPIRPTCELSLIKEELPIEEEAEIPCERPTAPFKSHEYSVISAKNFPLQISKAPETIQVSAKALELEEKLKRVAELDGAIKELEKLTVLKAESLTLLSNSLPKEPELTCKEIYAYETSIERLSRSIGGESRKLKEYEGHLAWRQTQLSEAELRLQDARTDTFKQVCQRREFNRLAYAYRRLLAEPSADFGFQASISSIEQAMVLARSSSVLMISEQQEAASQLIHMKQVLLRPMALSHQIGSLQSQIKSKKHELEEWKRGTQGTDI